MWEYKIVTYFLAVKYAENNPSAIYATEVLPEAKKTNKPLNPDNDFPISNDLEVILNYLGESNWELIEVLNTQESSAIISKNLVKPLKRDKMMGIGSLKFIFKRQKQSN